MIFSLFSRKDNNGSVDYRNSPTATPRKRIVIILTVLVAFILASIVLAIILRPSPEQKAKQELLDKATAVVQKDSPGATVKDVTTADGFAKGTVIQKDQGQDFIALFKVAENGDMTQIATGSVFTPITMLQLGISFDDQAKLTGRSVAAIRRSLMDQCDYSGSDIPGYYTSSFQDIQTNNQSSINTGDIQYLKSKLNPFIQAINSKTDNKTVCVSAVATKNAQTTNSYISISTTFQVQFITIEGIVSTHKIVITVQYLKSGGPETVTLDGNLLN